MRCHDSIPTLTLRNWRELGVGLRHLRDGTAGPRSVTVGNLLVGVVALLLLSPGVPGAVTACITRLA